MKKYLKYRYLILLLILLVVSYFGFFNDYLMYLDVKNYPSKHVCQKYYSNFPTGYFTEEVKVVEIEVARDIGLVRSFLQDYPESDQYELVEKISNELWAFELARYDSIVNSGENFDPEAVYFFKEVLLYLRDNNQSDIGLSLKGDTYLKDFKDYDPELVEWLDIVYKEEDNRTVTDNIVEIKKHFDQGDIQQYEDIISNSVESSFGNVLSSNFINVIPSESTNSGLVIKIEYHIMNQEDDYEGVGIPHIWTYTEGENGERFLSYLLGVEMYFEFQISVPNTFLEYGFVSSTTALSDIENITTLEEGYREMTKQNFQNFANGISSRFGIYRQSISLDEY